MNGDYDHPFDRKKGYDEGYKKGYSDGFKRGYDDGCREDIDSLTQQNVKTESFEVYLLGLQRDFNDTLCKLLTSFGHGKYYREYIKRYNDVT